jgi:hypothetical protein
MVVAVAESHGDAAEVLAEEYGAAGAGLVVAACGGDSEE